LVQSIDGVLSSLLRIPVDSTLNRVEHMACVEFAESLPSPCAAFVFTVGEGSGDEGVIDLSTEIAFYLIDRLLGGPGESAKQERPLSQLEQSILNGVVERLIAALQDAWSEHVGLPLRLSTYVSAPEVIRARIQGEVLVTQIAVDFGEINGSLSLSLPLASLGSLLQETPSGRSARAPGCSECSEHRAAIEDDLKQARVSLSARLPLLSIDARSLANLAVGKVIQTGQHAELPIELHINDHPRYLGTLGQVRRHVGIQITDHVSAVSGKTSTRTMRGRVL
jgi:flagellar motor switch protein FliM